MRQVKAYVRHWLNVVDDHSIHSPFFFDLYTKVVAKERREENGALLNLRYELEANRKKIPIVDLGSGAHDGRTGERSVGDIARISLTPFAYAQFYADLIAYFDCKRVVELGTSLGLTSIYLAQKKDARVFTFEGAPSVAQIARANFEWAGKKNIEIIEGNLDHTLHRFLDPTDKVDFALMDANHRYEPTVRYYHQLTKRLWEKSVLIIDDIHRSEEMEKAWKEIRNDTLIYGSVDLYRCGMLFFDPRVGKPHYVWSLH